TDGADYDELLRVLGGIACLQQSGLVGPCTRNGKLHSRGQCVSPSCVERTTWDRTTTSRGDREGAASGYSRMPGYRKGQVWEHTARPRSHSIGPGSVETTRDPGREKARNRPPFRALCARGARPDTL